MSIVPIAVTVGGPPEVVLPLLAIFPLSESTKLDPCPSVPPTTVKTRARSHIRMTRAYLYRRQPHAFGCKVPTDGVALLFARGLPARVAVTACKHVRRLSGKTQEFTVNSESEIREDGQEIEKNGDSHGEPSPDGQDYPIFFALLLVVVFTVLVFRGVGGHAYVYDDSLLIVSNPHLYPLSWENLKHFWTEPYASLYVPVTFSVLAVEAQVAAKTNKETGRVALDPSVFHYGNLVLHVVTVLLVLVLLRAVVGSTLPAIAGALLFALHPLQAETVNWITETKGLLAAMFGVIAVWQYWLFAAGDAHPLSKQPTEGSASEQPSRRWMHYSLATLAFGLALLSKPSAVAVPLVVLVLDAGLLRRGFLATILPTVAWFCLSDGRGQITLRASA